MYRCTNTQLEKFFNSDIPMGIQLFDVSVITKCVLELTLMLVIFQFIVSQADKDLAVELQLQNLDKCMVPSQEYAFGFDVNMF